MPGLEDLYREIILDHYRNPRNRGELDVPPAVRADGFNLVLSGRSEASKVADAVAALEQLGAEVLYCPGDVADAADRTAMLSAIRERFGKRRLSHSAGKASASSWPPNSNSICSMPRRRRLRRRRRWCPAPVGHSRDRKSTARTTFGKSSRS